MIPLREIQGVQYGLLELSDLEAFSRLLAVTFSQYEPMGMAMGLSREEILTFVRLFGPKAADEGLSLVAKISDTDTMIGALLSEDFGSPPPEGLGKMSKKLLPILTLLEQLDKQYMEKKEFRLGEVLHMFMVGVSPECTARGVATHLSELGMEYAAVKGYRTAVVEATGSISQNIARKLGFAERFSTLYKEFTFEGEKVFASIEGHIGTMLMDRMLV